MESDRLATLTEAMTKEKLDNQRDVVKNERRQGLENTPYGRWYKIVLENLYPAGHPYSWPTIGSHEDLTAASLEDVTDFFKTYYTPNNLSLVIAGDFDPAEAKRLVEKYFGSIPPGPRSTARPSTCRRLTGEKDRRGRRPGAAGPCLHGLADAAGILSRRRGPGSHVAHPGRRALVAPQQGARLRPAALHRGPGVPELHGDRGWFAVIATARPGVSLDEIEKVVSEEIAKLAKTGPTPAELARARTKQEFAFITALEGIGGFGGKSDRLNQYNTLLGDPGKLEWDMARYRDATPASVKQVVARYLDTKNRLLVRFRVEKSGRACEVALDRSKEPATGVDKAFVAPKVQTAKLPNGMDLFVVERPELPKVDVTFVTRAGAEADPAGKAGLAQLTVTQLDMGTPTRKALEIEDALGDLGVALTGRRRPGERAGLLRDARAQPRPGDGDRLGRHSQRQLPGLRVRPREEAASRRPRAAGEERERRRRAGPRRARLRPRAPVRPASPGVAVQRSRS